jgi:hypothetical protein
VPRGLNRSGSASVLATANAPSTPAAVPIALGDGSLRRSKFVVLVDELGRVVGVVVIEVVRVDVERLRLLLQLL